MTGLNGLRVLIVEDSWQIAAATKRLLEELAIAGTASSGSKGAADGPTIRITAQGDGDRAGQQPSLSGMPLFPQDGFIGRENIRHCRDRLRSAVDPNIQAQLQKLLVEEENKLAVDRELIAEVERVVRNGKELIESQTELVAVMERNGHDGTRDRALLDGLKQSQILHEEYHQRIVISYRRSLAGS